MTDMRKLNIFVFLSLTTLSLQAQFVNNGATVTIQSGATLRVETDFTNTSGTVNNSGTIEVSGNFSNTGTLATTGNLKFIKVTGSPTNATLNTGGQPLKNVEMAKTSGDTVTLAAAATILGDLSFTGVGNKIFLGGFDLTLGDTSDVNTPGAAGYVVTNGAGRLIKTNLGAPLNTTFTYPVAFDAGTYNPITITENGTADNIGVRVLERAYENGVSGTHIASEVVDASWVITEGTGGGSDLTITPQWLTDDEMPSFTRGDCGVAKYIGPTYDLLLAGMGASSGSGTIATPYARQRVGVTPGTFVVGDDKVMDYVAVSPKVYLGGPTPVSGEMPDNLRTLSLIPIAEPYTGMSGFSHSGRGGGQSVASNAVFDQVTGNGTQDDIVDWGFVELRSPANTVVNTKSVLIQRDGDIVDTDFGSVKFRGHTAGNYTFAFRHRNHLGIATSANIALTSSPTVLNFTDGSAATFGTNAQRNLAGVRMLWPGNVIHDAIVRYQGGTNDRDAIKNNILAQPGNTFAQLTYSYNGYQTFDANMNGTIRFQGTLNDGDLIKDFVLAHPGNTFAQLTFTINQQLP